MGRSSVQPAEFGEYTITIRLPETIGLEAFRANDHNYYEQLAARKNMPKGLRMLLFQLFKRGAIVYCSITFGRRVSMHIARTDSKGRQLMQGPALKQFERHFAVLTGQRIATTWEATSTGRAPSGGRAFDSNALLRGVAAVVEVAAEGLQVAAAIKILTDD